MTAGRLIAQAKVNLFLRVLARETSGYHALETLFQRIELGDDVVVRTGGATRSLDCRGADVGPVERNLAWRAAVAYAGAAGWPHGFEIEIDKRVPVGGGLGGGSADAGAVLRILNHLAAAPLAADQLLQLALGLGMDVPFLTTEHARALAWGRGERMLGLPPLPRREVALLSPGVGVRTADAFRWLAEARADHTTVAALIDPAALNSWEGVVALAGNDLEGPVCAQLPAVGALGDARPLFAPPMPAGYVPPLYQMTGSGATWFLVIADDRAAFTLSEQSAWTVTWTHTADRVVAVEPAE